MVVRFATPWAAWPSLPPWRSCTSFGETGISSPKPITSSIRVMKIKPIAGFRTVGSSLPQRALRSIAQPIPRALRFALIHRRRNPVSIIIKPTADETAVLIILPVRIDRKDVEVEAPPIAPGRPAAPEALGCAGLGRLLDPSHLVRVVLLAAMQADDHTVIPRRAERVGFRGARSAFFGRRSFEGFLIHTGSLPRPHPGELPPIIPPEPPCRGRSIVVAFRRWEAPHDGTRRRVL